MAPTSIPLTRSELRGMRMMLRLLWVERLIELVVSTRPKPEVSDTYIVTDIMKYEDAYRGLDRQLCNCEIILEAHPEQDTQEVPITPEILATYRMVVEYSFDLKKIKLMGWGEYIAVIQTARNTLGKKFGSEKPMDDIPISTIFNVPPAVGKN